MVACRAMVDGLKTQSALVAHLLEQVLPQDTDTLLIYFEYDDIKVTVDFMPFSDVDFGKSYSTIKDPTISSRLSPILIKKLMSVQS